MQLRIPDHTNFHYLSSLIPPVNLKSGAPTGEVPLFPSPLACAT